MTGVQTCALPISVELRRIKGELQQEAKLRDMQRGEAPKKTGQERREPSDEERRLIKQVNEAKKKGGYEVVDPEKALKTALETTKTRLRNQIADLDDQISKRTRHVRTKIPGPTDAEIEELKTIRDALKKEFDEVFGKREMTDEERLKAATESVEKSIAEYERRIKEGEITKPGKPKVSSPELEALKARRDALRGELDNLRDRKSTRLNSSHIPLSRMPSSA